MKLSLSWSEISAETDIAIQNAVWLPIDQKSFQYGICSSFGVHVFYTRKVETGCRISKTLYELIYPNEFQLELVKEPLIASTLDFTLVNRSVHLKQVEMLRNCDSLGLMWRNELISGTCRLSFLGTFYTFQVNGSPGLYTIDYDTKITIRLPSTDINVKMDYSYCRGMQSMLLIAQDLRTEIETFLRIYKTKNSGSTYLLYGARGTGKSFVAVETIKQSGLKYTVVKASELAKPIIGQTELGIITLFEQMNRESPSVLIIDDADELVEVGGPFVTELIKELVNTSKCFVIFLTSRVYLFPPLWLSTSVFGCVREMVLPQFNDRITFTRYLLSNTSIVLDKESLQQVAEETQGYSCADLINLLKMTIVKHGPRFTFKEFIDSIKNIQPANLSGIVTRIADISFKDLYGINDILEKLEHLVIRPFKELNKYQDHGITPPKGILIHGPSGVGKTALATALVKETGMSCIYVSAPSIRSKLVGESEQTIARLFAQARSSAPCIVLLDQLESLVSKRGTNSSSQGSGDRIITTFLTEMDGIFTNTKNNVFIVATTSNLNAIDSAITRPGRIDIHVQIPIPDFDSRLELLEKSLENMPNEISHNELLELVNEMEGWSSGQVVDSCREAAMNCIRLQQEYIKKSHFVLIITLLCFFYFQTTTVPLVQSQKQKYLVGPLPWASGEKSIESYAGYIPIRNTPHVSNQSIEMFFWYFPALEPKDPNPPLIIWLQGGPGSSSMIGLFYEMGPLKLNAEVKLVRNPDTWNLHAHMLFIDSPVGTGFSYVGTKNKTTGADLNATMTMEEIVSKIKFDEPCLDPIQQETPIFEDGYVANEAAVAHDLVLFMDRFYRIFPELLQSKLYLTGESYAGKYIPAFAYQIHKVNQHRGNDTIPLAGFAIGNGLTDPITQVTTHADHALALGLVSPPQAEKMKTLADWSVKLICQHAWKEALQARNMIFDFVAEAAGSINYYDVRKGSEQYHRKEMYTFLKDPKVKESLNVGVDAMFAQDWYLYPHLEEDIMQSAVWYLPSLVDAGYQVVLYQGQFDFRDGIMSQNEWISNLDWKGREEFNEAARVVWYERDAVAGYVTRYKNLVRVEVSNAGHLAPGDQGFHTLQMIERYLF